MGMNRVRKTYTEDFKNDAVALVIKQGYSATDAAKSYSVECLLSPPGTTQVTLDSEQGIN